MKRRILLIATMDDTYRQPLLEAQGYHVDTVSMEAADQHLTSAAYHVVLIATDVDGTSALEFCEKVKSSQPNTRVGLLVQRAPEYIPSNSCVDAVFHNQYSPRRFLANIRALMEFAPGRNIADLDDNA